MKIGYKTGLIAIISIAMFIGFIVLMYDYNQQKHQRASEKPVLTQQQIADQIQDCWDLNKNAKVYKSFWSEKVDKVICVERSYYDIIHDSRRMIYD